MIDGDSTSNNDAACTLTDVGDNPWWSVDLLSKHGGYPPHRISQIKIQNNDVDAEAPYGVDVYVSSHDAPSYRSNSSPA